MNKHANKFAMQNQMQIDIVVVCTDLAGKEPHRQLGMGRVMTSGSLGDVMVSILTRWGLGSCSTRNISHFHHPIPCQYLGFENIMSPNNATLMIQVGNFDEMATFRDSGFNLNPHCDIRNGYLLPTVNIQWDPW